MKPQLFDRDFKLTVGEEPTVSGQIETQNSRIITTRPDGSPAGVRPTLRVTFKITKNIFKQTLNSAEIVIYNLSQEHRGLFQQKNAPCMIEAGYIGNSSKIFEGQVNLAGHTKSGTDWVTKLHSVDGLQQVQESRINESSGPGTTVQQAANLLIKNMGIGIGNSIQQLANSLPRSKMGIFQKGVSLSGRTYDVLGHLMSSCGFDFSIQDNAVQILPPQGNNGDQVVVLDQASGLIGSVEEGEDKQKQTTVIAKSLLQAKFRPGTLVYINSRNANGFFVIQNVVHTGDNWGPDWTSDLILKAASTPSGGALPQLQKMEQLQ